MKFYGDLEQAALESLSSDPASTVQGRIWQNTTENRIKHDDGTVKRAVLKNDQKAVIGNNGTAANNIRVNRAADATIQFVTGDDVTAEGSLSASLAKTSSKTESYTDAGKPAAGNVGRLVYLTDLEALKVDNGATYKFLQTIDQLAPATTKGDLLVRDSTVIARQAVGTDGQFLKANSATSTGVEWASAAGNVSYRSVVSTDTATNADDVLILSGASFTQNLFTAVGNTGKVLTIKHNGTSLTQVYTIDPNGGQTIDDLGVANSTYILYTNGETLKIVSNGATWDILEKKTKTLMSANATITITGTTTNPTKGTMAVDNTTWYRDGQYAVVYLNFQQTVAGSAGSGNYLIALPAGLTADTTLHELNTSLNLTTAQGIGTIESVYKGNSGAANIFLGMTAVLFDSTHYRIVGSQSVAGTAIWGSANNSLANAVITVVGWARIKISGWNP